MIGLWLGYTELIRMSKTFRWCPHMVSTAYVSVKYRFCTLRVPKRWLLATTNSTRQSVASGFEGWGRW